MNSVERKRGIVTKLLVEIDTSQFNQLDKVTKELGISKAEAVSQSINIWLNMVQPKAVK